MYKTFLQPTDDMHNHIYLTYDNALVCYALRALAKLLNRPELAEEAERTRRAVYRTLRQGAERAALLRVVGRPERPL